MRRAFVGDWYQGLALACALIVASETRNMKRIIFALSIKIFDR
jgi:hypothetical protein